MIKLRITNLFYLFLLALFCFFGCSDSKSQRATPKDGEVYCDACHGYKYVDGEACTVCYGTGCLSDTMSNIRSFTKALKVLETEESDEYDSQEDEDLDEYYIEYEEEYEEPTQVKVPVQRFEPCIYCNGSGICAACNGSGGNKWYGADGDWHFTECVGCHGFCRCYYCGGRGGADIIVYVDAEY